MKILNPDAFWYLLVVIPYVILKIFQFFKNWEVFLKLGGEDSQKQLFKLRFILITVFSALCYVFIVLGYANIYFGTKNKRLENSGLDVVFALDVSRSMLAKDMEGSRLEQAKLFSQKIIYNMPDKARMAGVAFKGSAVPIIPLTYDYDSLLSFFEEVLPSQISSYGSNIASGLEASLSLFTGDLSRKQVIILLSDGEILTGQINKIIRELNTNNTIVYAIGFGTAQPFPLFDEKGDPILNRFGFKVESRLEESALMQIAKLTHGKYLKATNDNLNILINDLKTFESSNYIIEKIDRPFYDIFIICALICLILRILIRNSPWVKLYGSF